METGNLRFLIRILTKVLIGGVKSVTTQVLRAVPHLDGEHLEGDLRQGLPQGRPQVPRRAHRVQWTQSIFTMPTMLAMSFMLIMPTMLTMSTMSAMSTMSTLKITEKPRKIHLRKV